MKLFGGRYGSTVDAADDDGTSSGSAVLVDVVDTLDTSDDDLSFF